MGDLVIPNRTSKKWRAEDFYRSGIPIALFVQSLNLSVHLIVPLIAPDKFDSFIGFSGWIVLNLTFRSGFV